MCRLGIFALVLLCFVVYCRALQEFCPAQIPSKHCLLRTDDYDQQLWKYWAGYRCYLYTNDNRLYFSYPTVGYQVLCRGQEAVVPIAEIDNATIAFYDHDNITSMSFIRRSFKTDEVFNNYLKCCEEAIACCEHFMDDFNIKNNETHCPAIWDAWSCFPPTIVNTTARLPCSSQAYQSPDQVCELQSEKYCLWNQTYGVAVWNQDTNYAVCAIAPVYEKRHNFHVNILAVCILFCLPAIGIFLVFEKFRKTIRVALHRNLLISICVRNTLSILSKQLVILDALKSPAMSNNVLLLNGVGCRVLAFFENSAKNSIYGCMVLDGFYLHKVIVRAFAKEMDMLYAYLVLTAITFVPSLAWATSMAVIDADSCWMVDASGLQWIVDSVRISILAINTILLLDIVRIMILKLKQRSQSSQTKAAFRATLFLFPLFGIHIIITANKMVYDNSCTAEDVYDYARYTMEGLQGIFVALLFCYANSEVHNEVKNGYRKTTIHLEQRYGWKFLRKNTVNRRRTTTATYVEATHC